MVTSRKRSIQRSLRKAATSFPDAVVRTLASIPCVALLVILGGYIIGEIIEDNGPFELFYNFLKREEKLDVSPTEKFFIKLGLVLATFLLKYKYKVLAILAFLPMIVLTQNKSVIITFSLSVITVLALNSVPVYIYLITAFSFWLHTQLHKNSHKAITVIVGVVGVSLWFGYGLNGKNYSGIPTSGVHTNGTRIR